jgi:hypothetical protein
MKGFHFNPGTLIMHRLKRKLALNVRICPGNRLSKHCSPANDQKKLKDFRYGFQKELEKEIVLRCTTNLYCDFQ